MDFIQMLNNRSYASAAAPVADDFDRLKQLMANRFALPLTMSKYEKHPKQMECIFLDSTVESEAQFAMQQIEQLYVVHVENQYLKNHNHKVQFMEVVKPDWQNDPTGGKEFPQNTVYYKNGKKGQPKDAYYALLELQQ